MTETVRLEPGQMAPDFTLPSDTGEMVTLSAFRGHPVILYFYPAAMTPGCTTQACDFRDSLSSLKAAGYQVLGISKDPVAKLAKFRARDSLTFPLLSDTDLTVHRLYGTWAERKLYGRTSLGVLRSTFVVDASGTLVLAKYRVRAKGHVALLRRELGIDS